MRSASVGDAQWLLLWRHVRHVFLSSTYYSFIQSFAYQWCFLDTQAWLTDTDAFTELMFWCERHWMNEISVNGTSVQKNKHLIERSMMGAQRLCGCWSEEVTSQQNQPRWTAGSPISRVHTHVQWTQLKLSHRLNSIIQPLFFFLMWIWDVW